MKTKMRHGALWQRIDSMRLDSEEADMPFSRRLARENGWAPAFAARVVMEYKRFLYLAATANAPITPSDAVDQAWHLHLLHTQHYWKELCANVL